MSASPGPSARLRLPPLIGQAKKLDAYLKTLSPAQLAKAMNLSSALAKKTHALIAAWTADPQKQSVAVDSFAGDIYSGLQSHTLSPADRDHADKTLVILSGLYGAIRPLDGICPYRLEMGYRFPDRTFADLYAYWGKSIAGSLPDKGPIVNLAAEEYARAVTPFVDKGRVITPKFLTVNPKTGEPAFVTVHAKIARGAFARWLITARIKNLTDLPQFNELGYRFDEALSRPGNPVFVCRTFGGKGLSVKKRRP